ncbi:two-component system, NarL family, nitrate/nitrite response regulator NarL [Rhizobiales bacterium GAS191]|nr:two-component system, NarL family, nitrate/nitrite response regulator NarL [Rhizobiales bacterium GAS191]
MIKAPRDVATVVVCPSSLHREGLTRILGAASFHVVAAAASVPEVAPGLLPDSRFILLVFNVSNDDDTALEQIQLFRGLHPTARIALLSGHGQLNNDTIIAAFQAGIDAYFVNPSHDTLIKSLELVMLGGAFMLPAASSSMLHYPDEAIANDSGKNKEVASQGERKYTPRLSEREVSILRCLVKGDSNKVIARKNNIAEATAKIHVKTILRKTGVNNRTQAAIWAMHNEALIGSMRESEPARAAIEAEPSLHGRAVAAPSETRDATASPSDPSRAGQKGDRSDASQLGQEGLSEGEV